jgi:hypothetical protein
MTMQTTTKAAPAAMPAIAGTESEGPSSDAVAEGLGSAVRLGTGDGVPLAVRIGPAAAVDCSSEVGNPNRRHI